MASLAEICGTAVAGFPAIVRLIGVDGNEFNGGGYRSATIVGEWDGERIVYPQVRFIFDGATDTAVVGYRVEVDGEIVDNRKFAKPFQPLTAGDEIRIDESAIVR